MISLSPVKYKDNLILTTKQIAEFYNVEPKIIQQNFSNNKDFYEEGVSYYLLKGAELKDFKNYFENFEVVDKHSPSLYLWTEYGVVLHAKSIGTKEAWSVYFKLVDTYFRVKEYEQIEISQESSTTAKPKPYKYYKDRVVTFAQIGNLYNLEWHSVSNLVKTLLQKEDYDLLNGGNLLAFKIQNRLKRAPGKLYVIYEKGYKKIFEYIEGLNYQKVAIPEQMEEKNLLKVEEIQSAVSKGMNITNLDIEEYLRLSEKERALKYFSELNWKRIVISDLKRFKENKM